MRVLVVAPHPILREGLAGVLRDSRLRVVGQSDLDEGLPGVAAQRGAQVVVFAACPLEDDVLKALGPFKTRLPRVSAILVTPAPTSRGLLRAVGLGCSGYLPLSVTGEALAAAILQVSGGECAFEPRVLRELLERLGNQALREVRDFAGGLTVPEREVLSLMVEGLTNPQIGERLRWRPGTVKDYVRRIIEKLEVSDRTQAAVKAVRLGLVP